MTFVLIYPNNKLGFFQLYMLSHAVFANVVRLS